MLIFYKVNVLNTKSTLREFPLARIIDWTHQRYKHHGTVDRHRLWCRQQLQCTMHLAQCFVWLNSQIYKPAYHLITCHARNQRATHAFNVLMFQCSYREKIIGNKSESYFLQQVDKDKIYRVCQKLPVI